MLFLSDCFNESFVLDYFGFELTKNIKLINDGLIVKSPPWVNFLVSLGSVCRGLQFDNKRLITLVVLPTRSFAAGFANLGSLLIGAKNFNDSLNWETFKALPIGTTVYWNKDQTKYAGIILGFERMYDDDFILLEVTKPVTKAKGGLKSFISRSNFQEYSFSREQPLGVSKSETLDKAGRFFNAWVGGISQRWIWADGAESLIVGRVKELSSIYSELFISLDGEDQISMQDMLCMQNNHLNFHGKSRVTHPRGELDGDFPLIILDGPEGFYIYTNKSSTSNLLVFLDRSEFNENIQNTVLQLKNFSVDFTEEMFTYLPAVVPAGIEFITFKVG